MFDNKADELVIHRPQFNSLISTNKCYACSLQVNSKFRCGMTAYGPVSESSVGCVTVTRTTVLNFSYCSFVHLIKTKCQGVCCLFALIQRHFSRPFLKLNL